MASGGCLLGSWYSLSRWWETGLPLTDIFKIPFPPSDHRLKLILVRLLSLSPLVGHSLVRLRISAWIKSECSLTRWDVPKSCVRNLLGLSLSTQAVNPSPNTPKKRKGRTGRSWESLDFDLFTSRVNISAKVRGKEIQSSLLVLEAIFSSLFVKAGLRGGLERNGQPPLCSNHSWGICLESALQVCLPSKRLSSPTCYVLALRLLFIALPGSRVMDEPSV